MKTTMIFNKKFIYVGLVGLFVLSIVAPFGVGATYLGNQPGRSNVCFDVAGNPININLPSFSIGGSQIDINAAFSNECRRLGGTVSAVAPQYIGPGQSNAPVNSLQQFLDLLVWFVQLFQAVFWILTVGFGLYAAYLYLFSGGSKEAVSKAHRTLIYAVVAGIVSILAYAIPGIVDSFFR